MTNLAKSFREDMAARFNLARPEVVVSENQKAFVALGGIPRVLLYDNLKSVVLERFGEHIRFHPRLLELAGPVLARQQPAQMLELQQVGAGIVAKEPVVETGRKHQRVGPAKARVVETPFYKRKEEVAA